MHQLLLPLDVYPERHLVDEKELSSDYWTVMLHAAWEKALQAPTSSCD